MPNKRGHESDAKGPGASGPATDVPAQGGATATGVKAAKCGPESEAKGAGARSPLTEARSQSEAPIEVKLRKTIDELVSEVTVTVSKDPKSLPAEKLELLERLQRLEQALAQRHLPSRLRILKVLVGGLAVLAAMAWSLGPLAQTQADVTGTASELAFRVDDRTVLFDDLSIQSLSCDGVDEVDFGDFSPSEQASRQRSMAFSLLSDNAAGKIAPPALDARHRSALTLQGVQVAADSLVRITKNPSEESVRISVVGEKGSIIAAGVTFQGRIRVSGLDESSFPSPQAFILRGERLVLNFVPKETFSLRQSLAIHTLSFDDPRTRSGQGFGQPRSTILQGSILFTDLGGSQKPLRLGQPLRLTDARGLLRSLGVEQGVKFDFSGVVKDIRDGFDDRATSSMPSRLEWIRGNPRVSMVWAALAWLAATMAAVATHWRKLWT